MQANDEPRSKASFIPYSTELKRILRGSWRLGGSFSMAKIAITHMDNAQLTSKIESVVGFLLRVGYVEAIRKLVGNQKDLILIVPTGSEVKVSSLRQFQPWLVAFVS